MDYRSEIFDRIKHTELLQAIDLFMEYELHEKDKFKK